MLRGRRRLAREISIPPPTGTRPRCRPAPRFSGHRTLRACRSRPIQRLGGFAFNAGAPAYTFTVPSTFSLAFSGAGIGGGDVTIINNGLMRVVFFSTAENANTTNNPSQQSVNKPSAGNPPTTTPPGPPTLFSDTSTAGLARLIANAGSAVDFSSTHTANLTAGSIEGAGVYFLGSQALTVGGNNLSTTVSGIIDGPGGSLIKTGTGILTLSGTNTYTGTTTVDAGVLIVNGSIASSSLTTVNSGAVLLGSGTVGSTVVNAGGVLVPGNSPGTMTVAGDLTIQRNAFYVVQVNPL